jgi:succinyl-CoA---D-citramalate CoA-transferase
MSDQLPGPLSGVRVIDVGTRISAPFCAGLLGELGADVIKVELPGEGDFMRTMGPFVGVEGGPDYSLSWAVEGRGRRGVTCDLRHPDGKELFKRLVATADVLCENFRPGTLERWDLGPDQLPPDLVVVRISVFGQSGPYAPRPGLDRLGIAFGGLLHLTGDPDRPPVRPGVTVSDYLTGVFAAFAAVASLYGRDVAGQERPGRSAVIDAPLYGSILRILEWTLAGYDRLGVVRQREGNRLSHSAPLDNYASADGHFVCIVAGSDANFARLCAAMERPELTTDPRFATLAERAAHGDEINGIVAEWATQLPVAEITNRCVAHDVPVGTAYSAADIFADPHMQSRGDLVSVDDPVIGPVRQQAPFPRLQGRPAPTPRGAPRLGEHNHEVWCGLVGLSDEELADFVARGVV